MRANLTPMPPVQPIQEKVPAVRFPLDGKRPHWKDLLPRRWRRRVVIQGRRFVL
jgi:hypothetical protein